MTEKQAKTSFMDLKFFLGLLLSIYGFLLSITGAYYVFNPLAGVDPDIDVYWGVFMLAIGAISYYKSDKPKSWNRAFAISGIEHIEGRLKKGIKEVEEEI